MKLDRRTRYGAAHKAVRRRLVDMYRPGQPCALCGEQMTDPARLLDLAHSASGTWLGLAHRKCNRGDAARIGNRTRVGKAVDPAPAPRTRW
ncbi:hypothetical protein ABN034_09335 [Actinopolymorpha sp. B11F2]|uniref:hypothetical protein n=1 Tax=Actinopolymorpha sp. B11F2 TaxID=3160862 RepID=UPI0032E3CEA1